MVTCYHVVTLHVNEFLSDLRVALPGDGDALAQFAEEGDGRLGAGHQSHLLIRAQGVVLCGDHMEWKLQHRKRV